MDPLVEQRYVDQPVDAVEVQFMDERDGEPEEREPQPVLLERRPRPPSVGPSVKYEDFVRGPDRNSGAESAKHVVDVLALEPEHIRRRIGGKLAVELEPISLCSPDIETQFDEPVNNEHAHHVAAPDPEHPRPVVALHRLL